ncbi:MAG: aminotransferase class I/II-fold pyridoxal phosphate-dependent enzyme, partial [Solirubrobacteraceae bacterium]
GCDAATAKLLTNTAWSLIFSTALPPPVVAAAGAALELLEEQPRRVDKLAANARALREELAAEGFDVDATGSHSVLLIVGDSDRAMRGC